MAASFATLPKPGSDDHKWTKAYNRFVANNDIAGYVAYLQGRGISTGATGASGPAGATGPTAGASGASGPSIPTPGTVATPYDLGGHTYWLQPNGKWTNGQSASSSAVSGSIVSQLNSGAGRPSTSVPGGGATGPAVGPGTTGPGFGTGPGLTPPGTSALKYDDPNTLGLYNRDPNWLANFVTPGTAVGATGTAPVAAPVTTPAPAPVITPPGGTTGAGTGSNTSGGTTQGGGSGSSTTGSGGNAGGASHGVGGGGAGDNAGHPGAGNATGGNAPGGAMHLARTPDGQVTMVSGDDVGRLGYVDLGPLGAGALSAAATLAPGWAGAGLSAIQAGLRGWNLMNTNTIRGAQGIPDTDFWQAAGALLGLNPRASLGGNPLIADSGELNSALDAAGVPRGSIPYSETQTGEEQSAGPLGLFGSYGHALSQAMVNSLMRGDSPAVPGTAGLFGPRIIGNDPGVANAPNKAGPAVPPGYVQYSGSVANAPPGTITKNGVSYAPDPRGGGAGINNGMGNLGNDANQIHNNTFAGNQIDKSQSFDVASGTWGAPGGTSNIGAGGSLSSGGGMGSNTRGGYASGGFIGTPDSMDDPTTGLEARLIHNALMDKYGPQVADGIMSRVVGPMMGPQQPPGDRYAHRIRPLPNMLGMTPQTDRMPVDGPPVAMGTQGSRQAEMMQEMTAERPPVRQQMASAAPAGLSDSDLLNWAQVAKHGGRVPPEIARQLAQRMGTSLPPGVIPAMHSGGWVSHPVNRLTGGDIPGNPAQGDTVPINATPGEFMINHDSAQAAGPNLLHALNNPLIAKWLGDQMGGFSKATPEATPASAAPATGATNGPHSRHGDPHLPDAFIDAIMHEQHSAKLAHLLDNGWKKNWA